MLRSRLSLTHLIPLLSLALLALIALPALGQGIAAGPACLASAPPADDPCAQAAPTASLPELAEALPADPGAADRVELAPFKFRTCRCSCGVPCTTDADCGGGRCTAGITCCRMDSKDEPATFAESLASPEPAPGG